MKHPIRLVLALSASALFAAGCSNTPYDATADDTAGSSYSSNNIPEAGPLTEAVNTYNPPVNNQTVPQVDTYAYQPQPQPQYQPAQPQADNNSYDTYAGSDNSGGAVAYDNSANANANPNNTGGYDYSAPGNETYSNYAAPSTDTYASNNNANSYYSGGNTAAPANTYSGGGGGAAVQVFASGSSSKAEQIKNSMSGRGLPAVVDNVAGLYKVRVPFGSEGEARANLARVRSASGEPGAFVTFR